MRNHRAMIKPPTQKTTQHDYVQSAVRIPRDLHAELQDAAERNGRSMNAEIIARLQVSAVEMGINELAKQNSEIKAMVREILDKI